jgi:hypothetical protein
VSNDGEREAFGMQDQLVLVLLVALVIAVGVAIWLYVRQRRTESLRERFGPEYDHALQSSGDRNTAEATLKERQERVAHLRIRPLERRERDQFAERWASAQAQFVDDPKGAIAEADRLVGEVMQVRGYPVGDFEQRAADISVDHPGVVDNYRKAHRLALKSERSGAETEELRQAMVHYRALFEDLLETEQTQAEVR